MIPAEVLRQVRRVQVRARRAVQSLIGGEYHSAFKGSGLSFEDVRDYQPGDDVRRIDWNVTARTGRPFIKRFVEERELTLLLVVDLSGSLRFGSTATTKRAVAAEVAALLAFAAISNGDRVGLLAFTDKLERYVPPRKGSRHAVRLLRDVLYFDPESRGTDLAEALRELVRIQHRRAVVFFVSDFQGDGFEGTFRRAASKHDVIAVRIIDPLERAWPEVGFVNVQDPETGRLMLLDSARLNRDFALKAEAEHSTFEKLARSADADLIDLSTTGGHFDAVVEFLRRRERRRRR
jgi:uncharacterized protein (DUF58 family)